MSLKISGLIKAEIGPQGGSIEHTTSFIEQCLDRLPERERLSQMLGAVLQGMHSSQAVNG